MVRGFISSQDVVSLLLIFSRQKKQRTYKILAQTATFKHRVSQPIQQINTKNLSLSLQCHLNLRVRNLRDKFTSPFVRNLRDKFTSPYTVNKYLTIQFKPCICKSQQRFLFFQFFGGKKKAINIVVIASFAYLAPPISEHELIMVWSLWSHATVLTEPGELSTSLGGASGRFKSKIRSFFSKPPVSRWCVS